MLCSSGLSLMKKFIRQQPPGFLFILCLLVFGVSMLSISSNLENRVLTNPDVEMDWNIFIRKLSHLHYCVSAPQHSQAKLLHTAKNTTTVSADQPKVQVVDEGKSLAALLPDLNLHLGSKGQRENPDALKANVTVAVSVKAKFHRNVLSEAMSWHSFATGDMVGARGPLARSSFKLVMLLWPEITETDSIGGGDTLVDTDVCLIIQGPSEIIPRTKPPSRCYLSAIPPQVTREVKLQRTAADRQGKRGDICTEGTWTSFAYDSDVTLQVLLSRSDLLLVKDRLRRCGTFLISLSVLLFFCAALTLHSNNNMRRSTYRVVQTKNCVVRIPQALY